MRPLFGRPGGRHFQAHLGHLSGRDEYAGAVFGKPVVHAAFFQLLHHCAGIFGGERGVEGPEIALTLPSNERKQPKAGRQSRRHDGDALHYGKIG